MAPTLYMFEASPAVRSVLITAKAIGLELNRKEVILLEGEHLRPEYLKINPQHTVPVLVDEDGFTICESHAITAYLIAKYAKTDDLYPRDIKKKTMVDQRLHFDTGIAYARLRGMVFLIIHRSKTSIDEQEKEGVYEVYQFLETFLEGKNWIAGDCLSIADYSLITSVTGLDILVPVDNQKYSNLGVWMTRVKSLPEYEVSIAGQKMFREILETRLSK